MKRPGFLGLVEGIRRFLDARGKHLAVLAALPDAAEGDASDPNTTEANSEAALLVAEPDAPSVEEVSVGRFSLVGLTQVKEALGSRWPRLEANVRALTETVIRAHLEEGDAFEKSEDTGYLVLFARLGSAEADRRCKDISDEIGRRLVAASGGLLGGLELVRAEVPAESLSLGPPDRILDAALAVGQRTWFEPEAYLPPGYGGQAGRWALERPRLDVASSYAQPPPGDVFVAEPSYAEWGTFGWDGGPGGLPFGEAGYPAGAVEAPEAPSFSGGGRAYIHGLGGLNGPPTGPPSAPVVAIKRRLSAGSGFAERGGHKPGEVYWSYAPVWDFAQSTLIRYRLTAVMDGRTVHPHPGDYRDLAHVTLFENDLEALRRALAQLQQLGALGRRFPIVCPIHHTSTVLDSRCSLILHELSSLPMELRKLLTIEIVQSDQPATSRELDEFTRLLRGRHVSVAALMRLRTSTKAHISPAVGMITTDVALVDEPETLVIRRLDALADRVLRGRQECGVYGLNSRSLVVAASASGFRFLAGGAVHQEVDSIDKALRFTPMDLYKAG